VVCLLSILSKHPEIANELTVFKSSAQSEETLKAQI